MEDEPLIYTCLGCGNEFEPDDPEQYLCWECQGRSAPAGSQFEIEAGVSGTAFDEVEHICIECGSVFRSLDLDEIRCPGCRGAAPEGGEGDDPNATVFDSLWSPGGLASEPLSPPQVKPSTAEGAVADEWNLGDVILDLYEVTDIHTAGGMGLVYRVHHRGWNVDLAVKSPRREFFSTDEHRQSFLDEAALWVDLDFHPHVVSCYYVRTLGGVPRIFAEYVEGGSLKDWIEDRRLYEGDHGQALARMLDIAIQFAWGLSYAHGRGLIHQDVKPHNLMLTPDGVAKVTDFGLARARQRAGEKERPEDDLRSAGVTRAGQTPAYASPEQTAGKKLTSRTDLWSWGVSVLHMFIGDRYWMAGVLAAEVLEDYLSSGPVEDRVPRMPDGVVELLRECFRPQPSDRPASMGEVANRLRAIYEQEVGTPYWREEPREPRQLPSTFNNRALSMLDLGQVERAREYWNTALALDPHHVETLYNIGILDWQQGETDGDQLAETLAGLCKLYPRNLTVKYLLGMVHLERGDVKEARPLLEQAQADETLAGEASEALQWIDSGELVECYPVHRFKRLDTNVQAVSLSADGRRALVASTTLAVWDVATESVAINLRQRDVVAAGLSGAAGRAVAAVHNSVYVWNLQSAPEIKAECELTGHTDRVTSVSISRDGHLVLSGSRDGTVRLWDLSTADCRQVFSGHAGYVYAVALSADRQWAVSGGDDRTLRVWRLSTGQAIQVCQGHTGALTAVAVSADGRLALSGSQDGTVRLWNTATGECLRTFTAHQRVVTSVGLSPDGRLALSGSQDGTARLWDTSTGKCLRIFHGHVKGVTSVAFNGDASQAITGGLADGQETVRVWRVPSAGLRLCRPRLSRLLSSGELVFIDSEARRLQESARSYLNNGIYTEALVCASAMREIPGMERSGESMELWTGIYAYSQRVGFKALRLKADLLGHADAVTAACLSQDYGQNRSYRVASGGRDGAVHLWEIPSGGSSALLEGHGGSINAVAFTVDAMLALSGSEDQSMRVWDASNRVCLFDLRRGGAAVTAVDASPDGNWALSAAKNNLIWLWHMPTGRSLRVMSGHTRPVTAIRFGPDGAWAVSGSQDKTIRVWDIATGETRRVLEGHENWITSLNVTLDGRWMLSSSGDGSLRVWEVASLECRLVIQTPSPIDAAALSAEGRWAVSAGQDRVVRLWDAQTGELVYEYEPHNNRISSVRLSSDGRWLLTASWDRSLRLWELDWDLEAHNEELWDDVALPHLEIFLSLHTPYMSDVPDHPSPDDIRRALTRAGQPAWTEADLERLIRQLRSVGLGWVKREGVEAKLNDLAQLRYGPQSTHPA